MQSLRSVWVLSLILVVSSICTVSASAGKEAYQEPGKVGPWKVGFRELTFTDSSRGRELRTAIWYPAVDATQSPGSVTKDAPPDTSGGPYPLIVFSHGHRSINTQSTFLMKAWAGHGFVIVAPNHQKNTFADYDPQYLAMLQFARPVDLRFVTDRILSLNQDASSFLHGMIDSEQIGVSGHSFGGHTTLITAGATPNLDHLAEFCKTRFWDICPLQDEIQAFYPGQRIIDESDPRMKAALALAPDAYGWFLKDGMAKIKIPIMIMGGERDTICRPDVEQKPMYAAITSTKYLVLQKDADHMTYGDFCGAMSSTRSLCGRLQEEIKTISTAFWMLHLKHDLRYSDALSKYVAHQTDVEMQSQPGSQQ
jgi:predicted dienelactone hydrolase